MPRSFLKDFYRKRKQDSEVYQERTEKLSKNKLSNVTMEQQLSIPDFNHPPSPDFSSGHWEEEEERCETDFEIETSLSKTSDEVLQFLTAVCMSRLSELEYQRFLSAHSEEFAIEVEKLWNYKNNRFTVHKFCNGCGKKCDDLENCCNQVPIKFVRIGVMTQLRQLVNHYLQKILKIRQQLRNGQGNEHSLAAPFFRPMWESESLEKKELRLSGIMSVDGVSVPGNQKKLWPISVMLVDLPTVEMQKSCNIMLEGIAEGVTNPTTAFWNAVLPLIMSDAESQIGSSGSYTFSLKLVTLSSDQPAKRSIFGMKSHQSSLSCFFCLAPGTFYKTEGYDRCEERAGDLTIKDSEEGKNGFGDIQSALVSFMLPYETPIDLLHNLGEGLCERIMKELLSCINPKSNLFNCNRSDFHNASKSVILPSDYNHISDRRNGTDKLTNFRLIVSSVAIQSESISPKGRFAIVSLAMTANKMYTNCKATELFDNQMCSSAKWFLKEQSVEYMSCKSHEYLYHLPSINRLFGNVGIVSTFCFESSYQYAMMGYSSRLTRNFCETACSRVILHNALKREVMKRAKNNPSQKLRRFLSFTKGIVAPQRNCQQPISKLKDVDAQILENRILYGVLSLHFGALKSEYISEQTNDDVFFSKSSSTSMNCFRFVGATVRNGTVEVLAEPFIDLPEDRQFSSLRKALGTLTNTDYYFGSEVIKMLKTFEGIKYCALSGKRVFLNPSSITTLGCYINCGDGYCVTAISGAMIHT